MKKYINTTNNVVRVAGETIAPDSFMVVPNVLLKHKRAAIERLVSEGVLKLEKKATKEKPEVEDGAAAKAD